MENRDATVFVNYEKLGQGQNLTSAEGKRTESRPKEGRKPADQLEQAYRDLGKAYYEGGFEDPLPQLLPLFDKITRLKKEEERQKGLCPGCGNPVEKNAVFCGKCGYRLK